MVGESWNEAFERFGTWWRADHVDADASGHLAFSPENGLSLRTMGGAWLGGDLGDGRPVTLNGRVDDELWTLAGCWSRKRSSSGEVFHVECAFAGVGMNDVELGQLDEIHVEFDGAWSAFMHLPRAPHNMTAPGLHLVATVGEGLTLEIRSELVAVPMGQEASFGFRDHLRFIGRSATPMTLRELTGSFVEPVHDLIRLAMHRDVAVTYCAAAGDGTTITQRSQRQVRALLRVHWNRVGSCTLGSDTSEPAAFRLPAEAEEVQRFLAKWFDLHPLLMLPLDLRLADFIDRMTFAEPKFLHTAQALEALHRRLWPYEIATDGEQARATAMKALAGTELSAVRATLHSLLAHAHEPTFADRLKQLINAVQDEISSIAGPSLNSVVGRFVKARNAVTHWSPDQPSPDGLELIALRLFGDALFDLVVLKQVQVSQQSANQLVSRHKLNQVSYWLERALDK